MRTESSQHQYKSQLDRIAFDYLGQEDGHDYIFSGQAVQKHQPRQKNILVLQNEITILRVDNYTAKSLSYPAL